MPNFLQINENNLVNIPNPNLLPSFAMFNDAFTWVYTSGSGTALNVNEQQLEGSRCLRISPNVTQNCTINSGGTQMQVTVNETGNYIFSIRSKSVLPTSVLNTQQIGILIYVNGSPTEFNYFVDETVTGYKTYFCQLSLNDGDALDFAFKTYISSDAGNFKHYFDAFKLEFDQLGLGLPTVWSAPLINELISDNFVFVSDLEDLPTPSTGVIVLEDFYTYYFTKSVDLASNRLLCGENTVILGSSSENVVLSSTGLVGVALLTSNYSMPLRNITITANIALNLDGDGVTTALDWNGVNFVNCGTVGTIKDYSNFIMTDSGLVDSGALTFDGTIGTIGLSSCLINSATANTGIIIAPTCTITRRFRIIYSAFVVLSGETGINVSTSATIPNNGYILDTINFGGGGTYITGVLSTDNKASFTNCNGINNSTEVSQYYMNNNATATVVASSGVAYKVLGNTTSAIITQKFTNTNNRATYNGAVTKFFSVLATASLESGTNNQIGLYISKNGTVINESEVYGTTSGTGRAENITIQAFVELTANDYIEIFVENDTSATNVTVKDLNVIIK